MKYRRRGIYLRIEAPDYLLIRREGPFTLFVSWDDADAHYEQQFICDTISEADDLEGHLSQLPRPVTSVDIDTVIMEFTL